MKNRILLLVAIFALPLFMQANNIRVKLNSYNAATKQLNITLAWDNSWHDGNGQFRDAAWLFVKYKDITNAGWQHATLGTPNGSTGNTPAILTDTLNSPGVQFDVQAKRPNGNSTPISGYMVRRRASPVSNAPEYAGVYNVATSFNVVVTLPAGVTLVNPEFRVYALEMVNIPQGPFYAGDGSEVSYVKTNTSTYAPLYLTSTGGGTGNATTYFNNTQTTVQATYPNGVAEYFVMKYELSNEGYCEFMNTLSRTQQNTLAESGEFATTATGVINNWNTGFTKFAATFTSLSEPAVFGSDANQNGILNEANDAQNNGAVVSYMRDVLAYLDWAALRPMTGYEYEKACRGPLAPVQYEHAWGSAQYSYAIMDNDLYGTNETNTTPVNGPFTQAGIRNGAFAKPTGSNRLNTGGSYYGVMEMSNSCREPHTGYGENATWANWAGTNGDGMVNSNYTSLVLASSSTIISEGRMPVSSFPPAGPLPLYWNADYSIISAANGVIAAREMSSQGIRGVIK